MRQYPGSFQFNARYVLTVASHIYSCRFGTFLANTDRDRERLAVRQRCVDIWNYLEANRKVFTNFLFEPSSQNPTEPSPSPGSSVPSALPTFSTDTDKCQTENCSRLYGGTVMGHGSLNEHAPSLLLPPLAQILRNVVVWTDYFNRWTNVLLPQQIPEKRLRLVHKVLCYKEFDKSREKRNSERFKQNSSDSSNSSNIDSGVDARSNTSGCGASHSGTPSGTLTVPHVSISAKKDSSSVAATVPTSFLSVSIPTSIKSVSSLVTTSAPELDPLQAMLLADEVAKFAAEESAEDTPSGVLQACELRVKETETGKLAVKIWSDDDCVDDVNTFLPPLATSSDFYETAFHQERVARMALAIELDAKTREHERKIAALRKMLLSGIDEQELERLLGM